MRPLKGLRWISETLHAHAGYETRYAANEVICEDHTGQQHLVLFENPHFGRILMLDGAVQLTERDEFIYHEMISHVPLFAHGDAGRVLVVGGGDGGVAREVLKHPEVAGLTQVEIDKGVVDFSLKYLPKISDGAFDDPRLDLVIGDGAGFVARTRNAYDVIIVDSTDPVGPGAVLFSREFYANCAATLRPGGVLVTQNGVPFMQGAELAGTMTAFKSIFSDRAAFVATTPSYVGGPMAYGWGTDDPHLRNLDTESIAGRFARCGITTRCYSPAVHTGAFALPRYIDDIVKNA